MAKKLTLKRVKRLLKVDETKLDVYLSYYANEIQYEELSEDQKHMLSNYTLAWGMLRKGYPEDITRGILMKNNKIQERQARYIIEEAKLLFGNIEDTDKQGRRQASIAYYDMLSHLSYNQGDYELAAKFRKNADELIGLYDKEAAGLDPEDYTRPGKFVFINNVNVLNQVATDE